MVRNGICTRSDLFIMREGIAEESGEMPGVWKVFIKGGDKALEKRPFVTKEKLEEQNRKITEIRARTEKT